MKAGAGPALLVAGLALAGACCASGDGPPGLVHLEDQLASADLKSASAPATARTEQAWKFGEPRPEWRLFDASTEVRLSAARLSRIQDGVTLHLGPPLRREGPMFIAGLAIDLPPTPLTDWTAVQVQARSHERLGGLTVSYNLDDDDAIPDEDVFFAGMDQVAPVFSDGSVQTYSIPLRPRDGSPAGVQLKNLGVFAGSPAEASVDILSIHLIPRGASFLEDTGIKPVTRGQTVRRTLFAHAPASVRWPVVVPEGGRLDFGMSCQAGETVTYRVKAGPQSQEGSGLFEKTVSDCGAWAQQSVDLSTLGGQDITLSLEADSLQQGAAALWSAPVVSGNGAAENRPNVLFYIIDGGGADAMSLYGLERDTTPHLKALAAEAVVFDRAYSNSTWTQPSTASFMTSLHHSVLGGLRRGIHSTPVPPRAVTMAEHMHSAGWATAVFTANPNCARMIGLEKGVDLMRDSETEHHSTSSTELHERFREFRSEYPGRPWWVHIQTTDVHEPNRPVPPFAGMFTAADSEKTMGGWDERLYTMGGKWFGAVGIEEFYRLALNAAGLDRKAYFTLRRGLYEETMAYQDQELARFVEDLKKTGEWENTILVVAADHGHPAGTYARWGRGLAEPQPEPWQGALLDSWNTHVPLMFFWPGHFQGGVRIAQPVSMIDVLPTLLDLLGLPPPDITEGRSLVPLLTGGTLPEAPVVFDEFRVDERTGKMVGNLEILDGRWGASLEIGPGPNGREPERGRHAVPAGGRWGAVHTFYPDVPRLLLYDLEKDPFAYRAVNEDRPDLVEMYRERLLEIWKAHRALATQFQGGADRMPLEPEQLEQLKALGYIR